MSKKYIIVEFKDGEWLNDVRDQAAGVATRAANCQVMGDVAHDQSGVAPRGVVFPQRSRYIVNV
jgi:hypothetical protein